MVRELIEIAFTPTLTHVFDRVARSCAIVAVKAGQRLVSYLPQVRQGLRVECVVVGLLSCTCLHGL